MNGYDDTRALVDIEIGNAADGDRWREPEGFEKRECPECIYPGGAIMITKSRDRFIIPKCPRCHGTGKVVVKEED